MQLMIEKKILHYKELFLKLSESYTAVCNACVMYLKTSFSSGSLLDRKNITAYVCMSLRIFVLSCVYLLCLYVPFVCMFSPWMSPLCVCLLRIYILLYICSFIYIYPLFVYVLSVCMSLRMLVVFCVLSERLKSSSPVKLAIILIENHTA